MSSGKTRRLKRIFNEHSKTLLVPMDHGITLGPITGITNIRETVKNVLDNGANGVILHKGLARQVIDIIPEDKVLGVHLNAGTSFCAKKSKGVVCSVKDALYYGADFVSYHLNLGTDDEKTYFEEVERIQSECEKYAIPLLGMVYVTNDSSEYTFCHSIRVAEELGFDIVKVSCPFAADTIKDTLLQSNIPILISGGEMVDPKEFLDNMEKLVQVGVSGFAVGRNIFGSEIYDVIIQKICKLIEA